jgi:hypothetical protein
MKNMFCKWNYLFDRRLIAEFVSAACIYVFISIYLYAPYLRGFTRIEYLFVINSAASSIGCFLLSRRWTKTFSASILAGAIYAFGPFLLGFTAYHPFAGIPAAIFPWLFIPAVMMVSGKKVSFLWALKLLLCAFPFVIVILFFYLLSLPSIGPFFPMPPIKGHLVNFVPIAFPLTGSAEDFIVSFYHLPVCGILLGLPLLISRKKYILLILFAACLCLSFCRPILETPPIVWTLLPGIFWAVLAAAGSERLLMANKTDVRLILACFIVLAVLSGFNFNQGHILSGSIFAGGTLLLAGVIVISRRSMNMRFLLWMLFYVGCCADILWGAKCTLEQVFGTIF